ncbi:MAG: DNA-binding domain-containing protein [Betaproteobacteria bacterium]
MPSLRELQQRFADAAFAPPGTAPAFGVVAPADGALRIGIYRTAMFANYRNALSASYPVVLRLTGTRFFHTAVDAFVRAHPSTSGDLNVYGDAFGDFLAGYAPAANLPWLRDIARLEWAQDEAHRARDAVHAPETVFAALAAAPADRLPLLRVTLEPSCRLIASSYPVLRVWQVNQSGFEGDARVSLDEGADTLLVRRDAHGVSIERIGAGDFAWLAALAGNATLGSAIDAAQTADAGFDLGTALRAHIAAGTIAAIVDA